MMTLVHSSGIIRGFFTFNQLKTILNINKILIINSPVEITWMSDKKLIYICCSSRCFLNDILIYPNIIFGVYLYDKLIFKNESTITIYFE